MSKEVRLDSVLGKTEEEARAFLNENGVKHRVVRKDDENYIVTCDFDDKRANLEFDNDVVTYCYNG